MMIGGCAHHIFQAHEGSLHISDRAHMLLMSMLQMSFHTILSLQHSRLIGTAIFLASHSWTTHFLCVHAVWHNFR